MIEDILESYNHEELLALSNYESHDKGGILLSKESINMVITHILKYGEKDLVALMVPNTYTDIFMDNLPSHILYRTIFTKILDNEVSNLRIITMKNNEFISFRYQIK